MKVLLLGRGGQLGRGLQAELAARFELVALDRGGCDLADPAQLRATIAQVRPAAIVNAAAYTAVDRAESDEASAVAVNARAPGIIGEEAARLGAAVIHYSTDYVFDGQKSSPYTESDATHPLGAYGRSKRDGELALIASGARALTLRASWVVGAQGANFARTMLRLARERDRLGVVADQHGVPTPVPLLARVTAELLGRIAADRAAPFPWGLYHVAPSGRTNWFEYARLVLAAAEHAGHVLKVAATEIQPLATADYPTAARRPANSCLDTARFRSTFDIPLPAWQDGLHEVLHQILSTP